MHRLRSSKHDFRQGICLLLPLVLAQTFDKNFREQNMKTTILEKICLAAIGVSLLAVTALANEAPVSAIGPKPVDPEIQGEETAVLTDAPNVPPPITRKHATKVIVNLEVQEVTKRLAEEIGR